MKTRVLRVCAALLASGLVSGAVAAQSLGELAKREEERRRAIRTPGRVYTNETIRADRSAPPTVTTPPATTTAPAGSGPVPPSPSGVAPPSPSGQPPAATAAQAPPPSTPADRKQDEAAWRARIQNERDLLQRAQIFAEALQSRINALTTDFVSRDDPVQRAQIGVDRQKALAELERVNQEIQLHTKAIAAIQEEARKAGVPPGWLR